MIIRKKLIHGLMGIALVMGVAMPTTARAAEEGEITPPIISELLPEHTLGLVMAEDIGHSFEIFEETELYKMWQEDEMQEFLEPIKAKSNEIFKTLEVMAKISLSDFTDAFNGQLAFAFVGIHLPEEDDPTPELALLAEITNRDAANRLLDRFAEAVEGQVKLKRFRLGLMDIGKLRNENDPVELNYVLTNDSFVVTLSADPKLFKDILGKLKNRGENALSGDATFLKAIETAGTSRDFFAYLNVEGLIDTIFDVAENQGELRKKDEKLARKILKAVGISDLKWAHIAEAIEPPGFKTAMHLGFGSKMDGVFKLLSQKPVADKLLEIIPETASMMAYKLHTNKLMGIVRSIVKAVEPDALANIESTMAIPAAMGINIEQGILEGLGGEGVIITLQQKNPALNPMASMPPIASVNLIKNDEKFSPAYNTMMMMLQGILSQQKVTVTTPLGKAGNKIYVFSHPQMQMVQIAPAITVYEGHLVIALKQEVLEEVCSFITDGPEKKLVDSKDFKEIKERAGVEPGSFASFSQKPRAEDLNLVLNTLKGLGPMLLARAGSMRELRAYNELLQSINFMKLPTTDALTPHSLANYSSLEVDDKNISLVGYAPIGISAIAAAAPPAIILIAVPQATRARGGRRGARPFGRMPEPEIGEDEDIEF